MSMENAKKLINELQSSDEMKAKIEGITDPKDLLKAANEAGYDVTLEELIEADREFRATHAAKTELSQEELEAVAGGELWRGDDASDGHEFYCKLSYHEKEYQFETEEWCLRIYLCNVGTLTPAEWLPEK